MSERGIIAVTSLGHTVCHIGELVFAGAVLAIMRELQLEPHQATALALLGYILMGVGALPVGLWADAWGPTRVLFLYFLAMAGTALGVAAAPNTLLLFVALTGLGLAASIYHPAGLAMISLGVKPGDRGRAMGINGVAGSVGVATGPALGMLAASLGNWRLAYVIVAGLALVSAAMMLAVLRRQAHRPLSVVRSPLSVAQSPQAPLGSDGSPLLKEGVGPHHTRKYLPLAFLFGVMMLGGLNYRCLVTALPPYLSDDAASSKELAKDSLFVFTVMLVGGLGQYFGGSLADSVGARRMYLWAVSLLVPLAFVLALVGGTHLAVPVACLLAICLFAQQPMENSLLADWTSTKRRSISYGTKFALTFGVGAFGAQIVGWVWHEFDSLAAVFVLIAGSAALMAALIVAGIRQPRPMAK